MTHAEAGIAAVLVAVMAWRLVRPLIRVLKWFALLGALIVVLLGIAFSDGSHAQQTRWCPTAVCDE